MDGGSFLDTCDKVISFEDAKLPVTTPLIPVQGLRRDEKGELTEDAFKIVTDGLTAVGMDVSSPETLSTIQNETKRSVCTLNGQFLFLLEDIMVKMSRGEPVDNSVLELIRGKHQQMLDILSISRHFATKSMEKQLPPEAGEKPAEAEEKKEGFRNRYMEPFQSTYQELMERDELLKKGKYGDLLKRRYESSQEKNRYANNQLGLYGVLNVVAIGLLLYILYEK